MITALHKSTYLLTYFKAAERIDFKLAVLVYKCLHGAAPSYHADELGLSADLSPQCRLHSVPSSSLVVRRTRLSTISDRAFPVAAARLERSAATRNIRILSVYISRTSEDSPLPTLLPLTACDVPQQRLLLFSDTLIICVTHLFICSKASCPRLKVRREAVFAFADDNKLHVHCDISNIIMSISALEQCIVAIIQWMLANKPKQQ